MAFASFACGNDQLQQGFAESIVKNDCKGRLGNVNACCSRHTRCYEKGVEQKTCDDNFCKCAEKAAKKLPGCSLHMTNFCVTARTFGGLNYLSAKAKRDQKKPKVL
ncbi:unnamed protein product [Auanema sp. JU1783]|nr:unnamed protein product [Auanema sp. JU1783]